MLPATSDPDTSVCLDISCRVSLVDKTWLVKKYLSQKINTLPVPLKVRSISVSRHKSEKFAITALYILSLDQGDSKIYACIKCKLYLAERLKANIFIRNNVLCTEGFIINLASAFAHILNCEITIGINARNHSQFLKRNILANATTFIPLKSKAFVNFRRIPLPDFHNFLFHLFLQQYLTLYSHFFNHTSSKILIRNDAKRLIQIPRHHKLGCITKILFENCFTISVDYDAISTPPTFPLLFHERNGITIPPADAGLEIKLLNGIKIYGNRQAIKKITRLINKYSLIWESSGFVQVLPERWIKVHLKPR